jgi:hypothetical protein
MPWFKVDDSFHSHPKVIATDADALGLWVVAGAWSSSNLTDGFLPDHVLTRLLPDSDKLARKLVAAGLWRRVRGGYQFHDWSEYQPSAEEVRALREKRAAAGRIGGAASGRTRKQAGNEGSMSGLRTDLEERSSAGRESRDGYGKRGPTSGAARSKRASKNEASASPIVQPPTRPLPSSKEGRGGAHSRDCPQHQGQPINNCGLCRSEKLGAS